MKTFTFLLIPLFFLSSAIFTKEKGTANTKKELVAFKKDFNESMPTYKKVLNMQDEMKEQLIFDGLKNRFEAIEKLKGINRYIDVLISQWAEYSISLQEIVAHSEDINTYLDQAIKSVK